MCVVSSSLTLALELAAVPAARLRVPRASDGHAEDFTIIGWVADSTWQPPNAGMLHSVRIERCAPRTLVKDLPAI